MNNYYANDKNENLPHDQCLNNKPNFNRNNSQNNHVNGYNTNMREMNPEYMDYKYSNNWNQNSNSHIQRNESNNLNYSRPQNFENVPNMYKIPQNMNYMYQNDFQYQNFNTNSNFNENHNPNVNFNRFRNNSYSGPIRSYNPHMYQDMPRTSNYQKYPQFKTKKPPNFSYSEKEIKDTLDYVILKKRNRNH
ncbi:hypothetical protein A3Q56_03388 [Intoshia linei]|uniref:Uncharacterized protein n=1 Tax=Intoshia linei TaxID=1819745 RepID=A0A177B3L3_9BILA|nr:hypothetical protein A3Q56_03388 [Intoshia linei]